MVVEIDRKMLVKEPWVTVKHGKRVVRPAVISSICQLPQGHQVAAPGEVNPSEKSTFRIVDDEGPCYEFIAVASLIDDGVALNVESDLKFLR